MNIQYLFFDQSFSRSSRKRKSSNSSETTPKQLKDSDKYKSPATPSSITFGMCMCKCIAQTEVM